MTAAVPLEPVSNVAASDDEDHAVCCADHESALCGVACDAGTVEAEYISPDTRQPSCAECAVLVCGVFCPRFGICLDIEEVAG